MIDLIPCVGGPLDGEFRHDVGPSMVHEGAMESVCLDDGWRNGHQTIVGFHVPKHEYRKERFNIAFFGVNTFMPVYAHTPFGGYGVQLEWIIKCFLAFSQDDTILPWDLPASLGRFGRGTPIPIVRDWFEEHGYPNFGICSILTMIENRTLVSVCGPKVFPSWQEAILSLDFRRDR